MGQQLKVRQKRKRRIRWEDRKKAEVKKAISKAEKKKKINVKAI
jgi:hypothetical protein